MSTAAGDRPRKARRLGLRNFKSNVPVPKGGKPCRLERHYAGALRQLTGIYDELASHDEERFVFANDSYLTGQCRDYRREKRDAKQRIASKLLRQSGESLCYRSSTRYSLRIVKYCKAILRQQGVIGERVQRERFGTLRWGVIVAKHDDLAHVEGKRCVLHPKRNVAPHVARPVAPHVAPYVAPPNEKRCIDRCTPRCTPEAVQGAENQENAATVAGSMSGFDGGLKASTLLSSHPYELSEPTAVCASQKTREQEKGSSFTGQDGVTAVQAPTVLDLEEAKRKLEEQKARLRRMYPEQFAAYDAARSADGGHPGAQRKPKRDAPKAAA